jgi:hypothetical protein
MTLTPSEACVLEFCTRRPVVTLEQLRANLRLAPITLRRALKALGYFTSFNHNARFYTRADRLRFDDNGLWFYRSIGFSRHHTLPETLVALVDGSSAGQTPTELAGLLRTPVGNLLACLARQHRLGRRRLGHQVVYLAGDPDRREQQFRQRRQAHSAAPAELAPAGQPLPVVLVVLVEAIRSPHAAVEQWLRSLRRDGLTLPAQQLQAIVDHFQLGKKEALWPSPNCWRNCCGRDRSSYGNEGRLPQRPSTLLTGWPRRRRRL